MKGANGRTHRLHAIGRLLETRTEKLVHARLHFARGFVGERNSENIIRRDAAGDKMRNSTRNDARLARARAGENQHRTGGGFDGLALGWIEQEKRKGGILRRCGLSGECVQRLAFGNLQLFDS
jgi:hypothetical protein